MKEIFKDIIGFEGNYSISNKGRVISKKRTAKYLKFDISVCNHTSYGRVTLCKDGDTSRHLIHRLVAEHFIENPKNKPHVNHIDNDGLNNCVTNLEWCTASENMQHSVIQGRQVKSQQRATEAAVITNYRRYINVWKNKLGGRFLSFHPAETVDQGTNTKPCAAVTYYCMSCHTERLCFTNARELTKHNGKCPNCTSKISLQVEDIV